ncbi:IS3 family transposase [Corynebacterium terpenotabidum]|uniref:Integrase catalytic region n=1 Tax=Corynebacterium terpenotabidum Y-11 TaxID=1200352 RepID=S4XFB3_9CORY|nr:Integrase catalytic region [Corynebacterium terpenotabidum Y-11]
MWRFPRRPTYAARSRPPSAPSVRDRKLTEKICRVHKANYSIYGARKVHRAPTREGVQIGQCRVERLMRATALRGVRTGRTPLTTLPSKTPDHRPDLERRRFTADRPDQLWGADMAYIKTHSGWVYAAFVQAVFSRRFVGWQTSHSLRTDLALDAMGLWRQGAEVPRCRPAGYLRVGPSQRPRRAIRCTRPN